MSRRSRATRALAAAALALALVAPVGCTGVQTSTGEREPGSTATSVAPGSEEAQPAAGEEQSATEQPVSPSTATTP